MPDLFKIPSFAGYHTLKLVAETGLSIVFEAQHKDFGKVCLKVLKKPSHEDITESRLRFRSEATLLAGISSQYVVRVFEVGQADGLDFICLEWIEGQSLKDLTNKDISEILEIVRKIALGLSDIHEKGILHLDIKPDNIILTSDSEGRALPKIVDFGFSGNQKVFIQGLQGTPQYMPPEQSGLVRWPVDVQSDLYSLGILAYELLLGRLPFDEDDPRLVIQAQLEKKPPAPSKLNPQIHPLVERILQKLLEKNPGDRYQSATSLAQDLQIAIQRLSTANSSSDLELDQKSTQSLQLGRVFVGRSEELSFLMSLFHKTYSEQFQICFIEGNSGLGKTALLTELQNQILTAGAHLAYGKCQEFSRGLPFFPFGEAFNNFIKKLDNYPLASQQLITKSVKDAVGELKPELLKIAPSFTKILGEVSQTEFRSEEKANQKIKEVINRVIGSISHKGQPLLILIDDLQWADISSIELICYLIEQKSSGSVLFLGTYRPEEIGDAHPLKKLLAKFVPNRDVESLSLKPLSEDEIKSMVTKSLGRETSQIPDDLFQIVREKSRGNPFYITEILRSLIREEVVTFASGQVLWNAEMARSLSLPDSILEIVLIRLKDMPQIAQNALGAAAILGNPFSAIELAELTEIQDIEVEIMIRNFISSNIFKRQSDGQYLFYHDKILEACRLLMSPTQSRELHLRCLKIKERRPDVENRSFMLAAHAFAATEKELIVKYSLLAAKDAIKKNSLPEALTFLERVRDFTQNHDQDSYLAQLSLADVQISLGFYEKAQTELQNILDKYKLSNIEQIKVRNKIAESLQRTGKYVKALVELNQSLELVGHSIGRSNFHIHILLDRLMMRLEKILGIMFPSFTQNQKEKLSALADTLRRLWMVEVIHDNKPLLHISYRYLRIAELLGNPSELATAHQYLALTVSNVKKPNFKLGLFHAESAVKIGQRVGAQEIVAGALIRIAAFLTWQARSREALTYSERARETLLSVGNMWDLGNAIIFTYFGNRTLGLLPEALSNAQSLVKIGERTGSQGLISSGSSKVAEVLFLMNNLEEAEKNLNFSIDIAERNQLKFDLFQALKVGGFARLQRKQLTVARSFFTRAIKLNEESGGSFFNAYIQEAYLGWVDSYLKDKVLIESMLRSEAGEINQIEKYLDDAEQSEKYFREFGHVLRLRAILHARKGQIERSKVLFEKAFQKFSHQERPIDLAMTEMDWGLLLAESSNRDAVVYLRKAHLKFSELGIAHLEKICGESLRELGEEVEESKAQDGKNAEKIAQTLLDMSLAALSSLNPMEQARALLDQAIEVFQAERALLFLTENQEEPTFTLGRNQSKHDINQPEGFSRTILSKVQLSRTPLVAANTQEGVLLGAHSVVAKNLLSMMAAPIIVNDKLIGILYLDNRIEKKLYRSEDGQFLQAISSHIGALLQVNKIANLEIEKKYLEKDLELTAAVQSLLLPEKGDFETDTLQVVSYYQPANKAGGDWWWYQMTNSGGIRIFVGDVTGHGPGPAMITATVAGALRFSATLDPKIFQNQNYDLLKNISEGLREVARGEYLMTMNVVEIPHGPGAGKLWFAAAPDVYVIKSTGDHAIFNTQSSPLGTSDSTFGQVDIQLESGDRVIVFTDGIIEQLTEEGRPIGHRKWLKILKNFRHLPLPEARTRMMEAIHQLRGSIPMDDDMCIIMVEVK